MPVKVFGLSYAITALVVSMPTSLCVTAQAEQPYKVEWIKEIGTPNRDLSVAVAVDGLGNPYITGFTYGDLGGPSAGGSDVFLSKFDASGSEVWTQQIGTSSHDFGNAVAIDNIGSAYITGATDGRLGDSNPSNTDAFLTKFNASGVEQWTRQIGTSSIDRSFSVAVDGTGDLYITGHTGGPRSEDFDGFLTKFDASGNELWSRRVISADRDQPSSVVVDNAGNAFITGYTLGDLAGNNAGLSDAFLAKYDVSGNELWSRQIGTSSNDYGQSVSVDNAGNAYMCGYTTGGSIGGPNAGDYDAFLIKYDAFGNELWTRQIGTTGQDYAYAVTTDDSGNAYVTGTTSVGLGGFVGTIGGPYLMKFDALGNELWVQQIGEAGAGKKSVSVDLDGMGNAYISGYTLAVHEDAFLVKFTVPEPTTFTLLALSGLALLRRCGGN